MAVQIRRLSCLSDSHLHALAELLIDCVDGEASVSFMHPLSRESALTFWHGVAAAVTRDERALLIAEDGSRLVGTVQLVLAQPENQPHRADLSKMLVLRDARRGGVGQSLMRVAEDVARDCGKWLLTLDTASDEAARLYERLGWRRCGVVPDYALLPHGGLCDTTYFYRDLR